MEGQWISATVLGGAHTNRGTVRGIGRECLNATQATQYIDSRKEVPLGESRQVVTIVRV